MKKTLAAKFYRVIAGWKVDPNRPFHIAAKLTNLRRAKSLAKKAIDEGYGWAAVVLNGDRIFEA
jgi:hypothetical protein